MNGKSIINFKEAILNNNRFQRIFILAKTDFYSRYYGSVLGLFWALINPLARLIVLYLVFSYLVFRNRDPEFILYLFTGILTWTFFSQTTKQGIRLLQNKRYLLENIQINKIDVFLSHTITGFIGFMFNFMTYALMIPFFHVPISYSVLFFPFILLMLFVFSMAVSILLSVVYIRFKDLDHFWDIVLMVGFWGVPIVWDQNFVLNEYRFMLYINPITGLLINLRNCVIYGASVDYSILGYDTLYVLGTLVISLYLLKHHSQKSAEIK